MPTARAEPQFVAAADGALYAIGGYGTATCETDGGANERYNPRTDRWSERAPMTTPRRGAAHALLPDGRIVVLGGVGCGPDFDPLTTVEAYEPATDTWSTLASLPQPRAFASAATGPDAKVYLIDGFDPNDPTSRHGYERTVFVYDPSSDSWSLGPSTHVARAGFGAAQVGSWIYALGGETQHEINLATIERLRVS